MPPTTRCTHRNTRGAQVNARRLPADPDLTRNPTRRPTQSSQRKDLLLLRFNQDVAHLDDERSALAAVNVSGSLPMAGFQVSMYGRFWVSTEASPTNAVFLSAVVIWEARIKQSVGKLDLPPDFAALLEDQGFEKLPINLAHADEVHTLPSHHRDPFDRMLIAQAKVEGLTLLTRDPIIAQYPVTCELA